MRAARSYAISQRTLLRWRYSTAIQPDSGSNTGRGRTFHFHQLSDFAQSRSETTWLEPRTRANRLKICVIVEEKFLSFSLHSQAPVAPIFYR
jgi:hypothetical protein